MKDKTRKSWLKAHNLNKLVSRIRKRKNIQKIYDKYRARNNPLNWASWFIHHSPRIKHKKTLLGLERQIARYYAGSSQKA